MCKMGYDGLKGGFAIDVIMTDILRFPGVIGTSGFNLVPNSGIIRSAADLLFFCPSALAKVD